MPSESVLSLLQAAAAARRLAYAPYSNYLVGAALQTEEGRVFTGCNVENASYGLTICAERTAVFKAVSEGCRRFGVLALSLEASGAPCGACRQVLYEFAPALTIYVGDGEGVYLGEWTLAELLPHGFGPPQLGVDTES